MSCGPAEGLKGLADKVEAANDELDSLLESATGGITDLLDSLESIVQAEVNGIEDKLTSMIPSLLDPPPDSILGQVQDIGKLLALGVVAGPQVLAAAKNFETKWGGILKSNPVFDGDLEISDIGGMVDLLRQGATDIDGLCKLLPNIKDDGIVISVLASPVSFPEVDAVAMIKGHKLPELPKPKFELEVGRQKKEAEASFVNYEVPKIYFGPRG
jgi:hypothetical protein